MQKLLLFVFFVFSFVFSHDLNAELAGSSSVSNAQLPVGPNYKAEFECLNSGLDRHRLAGHIPATIALIVNQSIFIPSKQPYQIFYTLSPDGNLIGYDPSTLKSDIEVHSVKFKNPQTQKWENYIYTVVKRKGSFVRFFPDNHELKAASRVEIRAFTPPGHKATQIVEEQIEDLLEKLPAKMKAIKPRIAHSINKAPSQDLAELFDPDFSATPADTDFFKLATQIRNACCQVDSMKSKVNKMLKDIDGFQLSRNRTPFTIPQCQ